MRIRKNGKVINLTESDLRRIVKRVLVEQDDPKSGTEDEMFGVKVSVLDNGIAKYLKDHPGCAGLKRPAEEPLCKNLSYSAKSAKADDDGNMVYGDKARSNYFTLCQAMLKQNGGDVLAKKGYCQGISKQG